MLRLDFSPLPEELADMSELWAEAFTSSIGRINESLDAVRINKAFKKARHTLSKWPSPAQVIELMPRRPEVERLEYVPAPAAVGKEYLDTCYKVINGDITKAQANEIFARLGGDEDPEPSF
jgi:hypothetical protein